MAELRIDIFSDPVCPWCLVGIHRLNKAIAALNDGTKVSIFHHPYLLDANAIKEGEDSETMLKRKYGVDPAEMWDRLEAEAKKSGLDLDMRKQKMRYPSQAAQVLVAAAESRGTQHAMSMAMSKATYLDALNISDPEVLVDIGTANGFTREEVLALVTREDLQKEVESASVSASQQGVQGVPFFILGNKYGLSGAQPEEVFQEALETVIKEAAE
ncbi:DsbA family oxidoreductase [Maritalea porphyrae]|uniref:DsbA family oxidoreductase n=1 Tax=Maritalea porphyrae TaxID=880732 RepID=UPI0022AFE43F|nr:DsbA family oxidoreductase [Maritalea porphyrae]MCZ4273736.1 DsbA family oxidoreductase [Maritalea porphyrae]